MQIGFEIDRPSKHITFFFKEKDVRHMAGMVVNDRIPRNAISKHLGIILTEAMIDISQVINEDLESYNVDILVIA